MENKSEIQSEEILGPPETFEELNLKPDLLKGIHSYGIERPTRTQAELFIPLLKGKDTIFQALSGSGKTSAIIISILQLIDTELQECQAILLVPTRELAQGTNKCVLHFSEYLNVKTHCFIGGVNPKDDEKKLKEGVQIVVGTPGRVLEMLRRGYLKVEHIKLVFLDEADEMISRGFQAQIQDIFKLIPQKKQVGLFVEDIVSEIFDLTKEFMKDPANIKYRCEERTLEGIRQFYINIDKEEWKFETLMDLFNEIDIHQCIIYCNNRKKVEEVSEKLNEKDVLNSSIHGSMDQSERKLTLRAFEAGTSRVLVTDDFVTRGQDVSLVSLIINYDLPYNKQKYLYRIGSGGAFGRKGVAINLVTPNDVPCMQQIEKYFNTSMDEAPMEIGNIIKEMGI